MPFNPLAASKTFSAAVLDPAISRTLHRMKTMTKSERIQSFKNAGILTASGHYTKPYRLFGNKRVAER